MSIGDKLRTIDEHAGNAPNEPQKQPTESSRETGGGVTNRPREEEQQNQNRVPPRGKSKDKGRA
jgi:hypothetical protein